MEYYKIYYRDETGRIKDVSHYAHNRQNAEWMYKRFSGNSEHLAILTNDEIYAITMPDHHNHSSLRNKVKRHNGLYEYILEQEFIY